MQKYVAQDFALTGQPQYPSTAKKAQEIWTNYLNSQAEKGLKFVTSFNYAVGTDLNRRMVIFENEDPS
jgi:hypothetical protein